MEIRRITVSDETLRDGQQQVGVFFADEAKVILADLIAQTGVQQLAMMPAIHESEGEVFKRLIANGKEDILACSTMLKLLEVDRALACGAKQVILFYGISDRLMLLRNPRTDNLELLQDEVLKRILDTVIYAKEKGLKVYFAGEDATRANFDFLGECIALCQPYVEQFLVCDTLGVMTPENTYVWIRELLDRTNDASLSVHFHNDLGLALENTIQAVLAGVRGISGTFGGIGERAGNVALEQVLNGLRLRFGIEVEGIDYDKLELVSAYLEGLGVRANPPYSRKARQCETGIHVNSWLRDPKSYSILPGQEMEIWFGMFSGASNFQYLFEKHLGKPLNKLQYESLRFQVKELAIKQGRSFSMLEVMEFIDTEILIV